MAKNFTVRRVKSEEERYQGGNADYISLKDDGEKFTAIALFLGDPTEEEPGYFEFFQHYEMGPVGFFPCAGDDCPLCEDGSKPKTRALTLWYDPKDEKVKIFEMNSLVIKQFSEMRAEGDKIYGRTFRITRMDGNGNYLVAGKEVDLKKSEVKEKIKEAEVDLEELMNNKLKRKMEQFGVAKALGDDDDDEPTEKAKKTTAKKKPDPEPEPESDDDELEGTFTILKIDKKNEILTLEDSEENEITLYGVAVKNDDGDDLFEKGQSITVTATKDSEGDWIAQSVEVAQDGSQPAAGGKDMPDTLEDVVMVITAVKTEEETLEVENDDLGYEAEIWFQDKSAYDGEEIEFDNYEVGMKITVNAAKDDVGDYVFATLPEIIKEKTAKKKAVSKK